MQRRAFALTLFILSHAHNTRDISMNLRNTDDGYGLVARVLHWWMAAIIVGLIGLGLYMTSLPDGDPKWELYDLHKSLGSLIFILALIRLAWRHISSPPPLPNDMKHFDKLAAHAGHMLLYVAMFALPVTGYLDSSLGGYHLSLFGLFDVPMLFGENKGQFDVVVTMHRWIGYGLILLVAAHFSAVLKHHLLDHDRVLMRMLRGK